MKNSTIMLLVVVVALIIFVTVYFIAKAKYGISLKLNWRKDIIGTWLTEDGKKKLVIHKSSLDFIDQYGQKGPCTYKTQDLNFKKDGSFYVLLKPSDNNQAGMLGMYEEIIHRDHSLIGGIMIYDLGYHETEFRKDWSPVTTK